MPVQIKRVYLPAAKSDGTRVLVDRLWPRGVSKESAAVDYWLKDIAPSDQLRKWYHERPSQWLKFQERYLEELREEKAIAALEQLYAIAAKRRRMTLVFASKNLERNNAVVLQQLLNGMRKPPRSTGPMKAGAMPRAARARR